MFRILSYITFICLLAVEFNQCKGTLHLLESRYDSPGVCDNLPSRFMRHDLNSASPTGFFELLNGTTIKRTIASINEVKYFKIGECYESIIYEIVDEDYISKRFALEVQKFASTPNFPNTCSVASNYENMVIPRCQRLYNDLLFRSQKYSCSGSGNSTQVDWSYCLDPFCIACVWGSHRPRSSCEFSQNALSEDKIILMNDVCWNGKRSFPSWTSGAVSIKLNLFFVVVSIFALFCKFF